MGRKNNRRKSRVRNKPVVTEKEKSSWARYVQPIVHKFKSASNRQKISYLGISIGLLSLFLTCYSLFFKHNGVDRVVTDQRHQELIRNINEIRLEGDNTLMENYIKRMEEEYDLTFTQINESISNFKTQEKNKETPWFADMLFYSKEYEQAFPVYLNAAYHGNAYCQNKIGRMYRKGLGTPVDIKKSLIFHTQAAEQGNANSQNELGIIYGKGLLGSVNNDLSFEYYEKAASSSNPIYLTNLAFMYQNGLGTQIDLKHAKDLLVKAAGQGYHKAQYNLGVLYFEEERFAAESYKAEQYFLKAANQGNSEANFALGMFYITNGKKQRSIEFLEIAAEENHPLAIFNLGIVYVSGKGELLDIEKGTEYLVRAAKLDEENAKYYLDRYFPKIKY